MAVQTLPKKVCFCTSSLEMYKPIYLKEAQDGTLKLAIFDFTHVVIWYPVTL